MTEDPHAPFGQVPADGRPEPYYSYPPAPQPPAQPYAPQAYPPSGFAGHAYPPAPQWGGPAYVVQQPGNGTGTAGFVLGLLGLIFCWIPVFGLLLGVLGVVFGAAGLSHGRKTGASTGLAIAGLVLGIISLIPALIILGLLVST